MAREYYEWTDIIRVDKQVLTDERADEYHKLTDEYYE